MKRVRAQLISRLGFCVLVLATTGGDPGCLHPEDIRLFLFELNEDAVRELDNVASEEISVAAYVTFNRELKVGVWRTGDPASVQTTTLASYESLEDAENVNVTLQEGNIHVTVLEEGKPIHYTEDMPGSRTFNSQVVHDENYGHFACDRADARKNDDSQKPVGLGIDEETGTFCAGITLDGKSLDLFNMPNDEDLFLLISSTSVQGAEFGVPGVTTEWAPSVSLNSERGEFGWVGSVTDQDTDELKVITFNTTGSLVNLTRIDSYPQSQPKQPRRPTALLSRGNNLWVIWSDPETNVLNATVCNPQRCIHSPLWHHPSDLSWTDVPVDVVPGPSGNDAIVVTVIPNPGMPSGGNKVIAWSVDEEGNGIPLKGGITLKDHGRDLLSLRLPNEKHSTSKCLLLSTSLPTPAVSSCFPLGSLPLLFNSLSSGVDRAWSQIWWAPIPLRAKRFLA